MNASKILQKLT